MKVLIVDDEPLARRRLRRLLSRCEGIDEIGEADSGAEALDQVNAAPPDLILLDIDMPGVDGLAVARALPSPVSVVFTTAHREHAPEAFRLAALDYLLKPIDEVHLREALGRVRARKQPPPSLAHAVEQLLRLRSGTAPLRLSARSGDVVELLDPARIPRLFASDKYTLCRVGGREYVLDDSLSELETRLVPHGFLRVHRRELICLARVRALRPVGSAAEVELDDGQRAEVSRRSLAGLKEKLGLR